MASFVTKAFQKAVLIHSKYASAGTVRKKPQSSHFYLLATTNRKRRRGRERGPTAYCSLFFWTCIWCYLWCLAISLEAASNSAILESYDGSRQLSLLYHILSLHFCFLFFFPSSFPFRAEGVNGRWSACRPSCLFISADRHHRVCSTAVCVCSQWL